MKIEGYACHFNKRNANGEIVTPKSFDAAIKYFEENNLKIPVNFNHNESMILGHITHIEKRIDGLYITAELNDDVDMVKNYIKPLIKDGTFDRFSTEGYIDLDKYESISEDTYIAKAFDLRAVAIVPNPADIDAIFTANGKHQKSVMFFDAFEKSKNRVLSVV